jgi:hypothetical protein
MVTAEDRRNSSPYGTLKRLTVIGLNSVVAECSQ